MSDDLKNSEEELLNAEIKCAETNIKLIDEILERGTLEQKIDFILSDIQQRERNRLNENIRKLRMKEILSMFFNKSTELKEDYYE